MSDAFKIEELPNELITIVLTYVPVYQLTLELPNISYKLRNLIFQPSTLDIYKRETEDTNCEDCIDNLYQIYSTSDGILYNQIRTCLPCYAKAYRGFPEEYFEDRDDMEEFEVYLELFVKDGVKDIHKYDDYRQICLGYYENVMEFINDNDENYCNMVDYLKTFLNHNFASLWESVYYNKYIQRKCWYYRRYL